MPHLYLDLIGDDLYAELIFMGKENDNLKMYIYRRMKDNLWREATNAVIAELEAKVNTSFYFFIFISTVHRCRYTRRFQC